MAEANKIAGVDTKGQELNNKWQEIENRIQLSKENIAESNITEAAANAKKATELWKQEALNTKYLDETQEERVAKLVAEIALLQKEGAVQDSIVDVNYNTARKIEKEVENFYYEMITRRMSAEAAKEELVNKLYSFAFKVFIFYLPIPYKARRKFVFYLKGYNTKNE